MVDSVSANHHGLKMVDSVSTNRHGPEMVDSVSTNRHGPEMVDLVSTNRRSTIPSVCTNGEMMDSVQAFFRFFSTAAR